MKENMISHGFRFITAVTVALFLLATANVQSNAQSAKTNKAANVCNDCGRRQTTYNGTTRKAWKTLNGQLTFFMANDLGRNGYYEQKPIAELMGEMANVIGPECILAIGDIHHFNGVVSTQDPLWMTNYELIYSHPELMIDWLPVCGNHEYRGNTQAVLDYGKVSRRWMMPAKYYTKAYEKKGTTIRLVFLDTTPLIDKYRKGTETYPNAAKQDMEAQLQWLDKTLSEAKEDWVIVLGHHPMYAYTDKSEKERLDMQARVQPILRKYHNVSIYACGHIHNFQHLKMKGDDIDYVVNSSASLARPVEAVEGTVFCSPAEGFAVFSVDKKQLRMSLIDKNGQVLHTITKTK